MRLRKIWIMHKKIFLALSACILFSGCSSLEMGWRAQAKGNYNEAQTQAAVALSQDPMNPEVYRLIATTALAKGDWVRAQRSAEFALSLDKENSKTEKLLRKIYAVSQKNEDLCESGRRAVENGQKVDASEIPAFQQSYEALAPKSAAYGCLTVLSQNGVEAFQMDKTRAAYVRSCLKQGKMAEASRVLALIGEGRFRIPEEARLDYAMQKRIEGRDLLLQYIADRSIDAAEKEDRIQIAKDIFENYYDWSASADVLVMSSLRKNSLERVVALKKCFRTQEAEEALNAYIESIRADVSSCYSGMEQLLTLGYGDNAYWVYENCFAEERDSKVLFEIAKLFEDNTLPAFSIEIVNRIVELYHADKDVLYKAFQLYARLGYAAKALAVSDEMLKLGVLSDEQMAERFSVMNSARAFQRFESESKTWMEQTANDKAFARLTVAKWEINRKNDARAIEICENMEKDQMLSAESIDLCMEAYARQRQYAKLDTWIERYKSDMDPFTRIQYFQDVDAEREYKKSLNQALAGTANEQYEARMSLARFAFFYKHDENEGKAQIDLALELDKYSEYAYERVTSLLYQSGANDLSLEYGKKYIERFPESQKSYALLGELYLKLNRTEDAAAIFDKFIELSTHTANDLQTVLSQYSRFNFSDAGLYWLENAAERAKETPEYHQYLSVLAPTRKNLYSASRRAAADEPLRLDAIEAYQALFAIDSTAYATDVLYGFTGLDAWKQAENVCMAIVDDPVLSQKPKFSTLKTCLTVAVHSDNAENLIPRIIRRFSEDSDVLGAGEVLEKTAYFYLLKDSLEGLLDSKEAKTARAAYAYLTQIDGADGDIDALQRHMADYEKKHALTYDERMKFAQQSMDIGNFDEAVRHLSLLQGTYSESRGILWAQIALSRRAPEHKPSQALLQATLASSEGVFHRLEWLAQGYAQVGDYRNALIYGQKAWDTGAVKSDSLRYQIVEWLLSAGLWEENESVAQSHLAALRDSKTWQTDRIKHLARMAYVQGYAAIGAQWMEEASRLEPSDVSLKQYRLEQALARDDRGQIVASLDAALDLPMADVSSILESARAYSDILDAIDIYEQNGRYDLALEAMLAIWPAFVERRGKQVAVKRLLDALAVDASQKRAVYDAVARLYLKGDIPCEAYVYVLGADSAELWYKLLARCSEAEGAIASALGDYRRGMTARARERFDSEMVRVDSDMAQFNDALLARVGIELAPFDALRRSFGQHHAVDALARAQQSGVVENHYIELAKTMALEGYSRELGDYLTRVANRISDEEKSRIWGIMQLLRYEEEDNAENSGNMELYAQNENVDPSVFSAIDRGILGSAASPERIAVWLNRVPTQQLAGVLVMAAKTMANDAANNSKIWRAFDEMLAKRHNRANIMATFAQALVEEGVFTEAEKAFRRLVALQPVSAFARRALSVALAQSSADGALDEAWRELVGGAGYAASENDYWKIAWTAHSRSPLAIRQQILGVLRQMEPVRKDWFVADVSLALEAQQWAEANRLTLEAYRAFGEECIRDLTDLYEKFDKLTDMPEEIYSSDAVPAWLARAKHAYAVGDRETASIYWKRAIERAADYESIFADTAEMLFYAREVAAFESLVAWGAQRFPHSARTAMFRAVGNLAQHKIDDAKTDLALVREKAVGNAEVANVAAYAVLFGHEDLAREALEEDIARVDFEARAYWKAFVEVFSDVRHEAFLSESRENMAKRGFDFVLGNLIPLTKSDTLDATLLPHLVDWAKNADREDWGRLFSSLML